MDKILQWSIAQQTGDQNAANKIGQPDPNMLNQLFGGPDEPTLMMQSMAVVNNEEATLPNKEVAFGNFEMLIENMDNANNIENIKLWPLVVRQLREDVPESLRIYGASCVGIAVQNNPKSQQDFLKYEDGLKELINICNDDSSPRELYLKAMLAVSSFIRNFQAGYNKFDELGGWEITKTNRTGEPKVYLRLLSLISAILSTEFDKKKEAHVHHSKLIERLTSILHEGSDISCIDKALFILMQMSSLDFQFNLEEVSSIAKGLEKIEPLKDRICMDDYVSVKYVVENSKA